MRGSRSLFIVVISLNLNPNPNPNPTWRQWESIHSRDQVDLGISELNRRLKLHLHVLDPYMYLTLTCTWPLHVLDPYMYFPIEGLSYTLQRYSRRYRLVVLKLPGINMSTLYSQRDWALHLIRLSRLSRNRRGIVTRKAMEVNLTIQKRM